MRESFAFRTRMVLVKSPNLRHQAARRRALAAGGVLAIAVVSGAIGVFNRAPETPVGQPHTGPFSYIPSE